MKNEKRERKELDVNTVLGCIMLIMCVMGIILCNMPQAKAHDEQAKANRKAWVEEFNQSERTILNGHFVVEDSTPQGILFVHDKETKKKFVYVKKTKALYEL